MIIAAAIKHNNRVYVGKRHGTIIQAMVVMGLNKGKILQREQGFICKRGHFYTREEALYHALLCKQITGKHLVRKGLLSEELW